MVIDDILADASAIVELRAGRADDALAELAAALARQISVAPNLLLERLREREATGSTAVGHGLALPHASVAIERSRGVLGLARAGIEFASPDGAPVRLFLTLASPSQPGEHLQALACISRVFAQSGIVDRILECPDADSILALLRGGS
jgi:nitrogen PTS system EIIA component